MHAKRESSPCNNCWWIHQSTRQNVWMCEVEIPAIIRNQKRPEKQAESCNVQCCDRSKRGHVERKKKLLCLPTQFERRGQIGAGRKWSCRSGSWGNISACCEVYRESDPEVHLAAVGDQHWTSWNGLGHFNIQLCVLTDRRIALPLWEVLGRRFGQLQILVTDLLKLMWNWWNSVSHAGWTAVTYWLWATWCWAGLRNWVNNTGKFHCSSKVLATQTLVADGNDLAQTALTETKTRTGPKLGQDWDQVKNLVRSPFKTLSQLSRTGTER